MVFLLSSVLVEHSLNTSCLAAESKINYLHGSNGVSKLISTDNKAAFPQWNALQWSLLVTNDNRNFAEKLITGFAVKWEKQ